jgi:hypothetical protein
MVDKCYNMLKTLSDREVLSILVEYYKTFPNHIKGDYGIENRNNTTTNNYEIDVCVSKSGLKQVAIAIGYLRHTTPYCEVFLESKTGVKFHQIHDVSVLHSIIRKYKLNKYIWI